MVTLEMTSALLIHEQYRLWCKFKTHFPSPISLSGKTLPHTRDGLRAHRAVLRLHRHNLIAGMTVTVTVLH